MQSIEKLRLVVVGELVDIFVLVGEIIGRPDQGTLQLLRPSGRHLGGKAAGGHASFAAGEILLHVDFIFNVGVFRRRAATTVGIALINAHAISQEAGTQTRRVIRGSDTRTHGECKMREKCERERERERVRQRIGNKEYKKKNMSKSEV